ncbi:hypothetical protein OFC56_37855, partial [Escherichia coli]|nr:hypothetical protein [Escherichia coli]
PYAPARGNAATSALPAHGGAWRAAPEAYAQGGLPSEDYAGGVGGVYAPPGGRGAFPLRAALPAAGGSGGGGGMPPPRHHGMH